MKPYYKLFINDADITPRVQGRVLSISLEDTAGFNNDRLIIEIEAVPAIEVPRRGALATLMLGYESGPNLFAPVPLTNMGLFEFDESEVQKSKSKGRTISMHFHSLPMGSMWKESQNRTYDEQMLASIVEHIAQAHNLTPRIDPDFYFVRIPYMAQKDEADHSFLTALGLRYGANFKISGKELIFGKVGTIQGLADTLKESDTESWRWLNQSTSNYGAVVANSYNSDTGKYEYSTEIVRTNASEAEREENARLTLPMQYPSKEQAEAAAIGRAAALEVQGHTFSFTTKWGNPLLKAEMMLQTNGFYDVSAGVKMPSFWHLTEVTHTLDKNGFRTSGKCDRPAIAATLLGPNASSEEREAAFEAAEATVKALQKQAKETLKDNREEANELQNTL